MTRKEFAQRLARRARRAGIGVPPDLADQLWIYLELLFRWNVKINLTSLSAETPDETIDRLLIEPLIASRHVLVSDRHMIDVGSGGGSPAIPMRLAAPHLKLVMVESKARKSAFLREALRKLEINGTVETARFEELLTRPEFHENFDMLTVRAVKVDSRTLSTLQAFVRPGGRILLFGRANQQAGAGWTAPPLQWQSAVPLATQDAELSILEKLRIP